MVQICYFFIHSFRSLQDIGISLDARYLYSVDTENRKITVKPNPDYIDGFWPKGISSLSAIVGNNGAGKTSALLYMIQALEEGNGEEDVMAIIIYRQHDVLYAYIGKSYGYSITSEISEPIQSSEQRPRMNIFYYSSYFRPYQNWFEPGEGELSGVYNASDTWRLIKDYQDYTNVDTMHRTVSIGEHMDALLTQDNNRIIQLIHDEELRTYLPKNVIPKYIIVQPNLSGYNRLIFEINQHNRQSSTEERIGQIQFPFSDSSKDGLLANIVASNLFNICVEQSVPIDRVQQVIVKWEEVYKETRNDVRAALIYLYKDLKIAHSQLYKLQEIVNFLYEACEGGRNTQSLYIDAFDAKNRGIIQKIKDYFSDRDFLVAHPFDLAYSHTNCASTHLSSGEYDMLKFFSRLYDAVCILPSRFTNLNSPQLLLIDEAENSYHPEWQRKFINMLVKFTQALYERNGRQRAFQILLTTHSPILLSDIPMMFVNYLEKDPKTGLVIVSSQQEETFGANVFDLYRNAFFMHDGLIGEFAQDKITAIQYAIEHHTQSPEKIMKTIELIGDKAIKTYLYSLLERDYKDDMISYYELRVSELKNNKYATDK